MAALLAGSLSRTVGKALSSVFLSATLTQGATAYPCKAIFENYGRFSGAGGASTCPDAKILILAASLAVSPLAGDVIAIPSAPFASGLSFVILSMKDSVNAVSIDPAGAVWTIIGKAVPLQANAYASYAALAQTLGSSVSVYRSSGSNPIAAGNLFDTRKAIFADGKSQGFNFNRAATYDDVLQNALIDATSLQLGDFLVGTHTYFVASMEPLRPVNVVECNQIITVSRPNSEVAPSGGSTGGMPSQQGGPGTYWGANRSPAADTSTAGEAQIVLGIPCAVQGTAGRATGTGEDPSGSAGPTRWKFYLPQSVFPKGSVKDGDFITDQESYRHMISAAAWTPIGYRAECVRKEVQG